MAAETPLDKAASQPRTRGEARRALLRARGVTLADVARQLGCHLSIVSRVECREETLGVRRAGHRARTRPEARARVSRVVWLLARGQARPRIRAAIVALSSALITRLIARADASGQRRSTAADRAIA